ncbi:alcohol oxidase [Annulohypoxylon truncatum]|uniref:alcohol oxidase n=1 Tax=Annulohypoxylon truncatum TaxID=327061 RepID=UPI0020086D63|nr:alcohol oxidase [Annulohypoxylon truncatum]KAI1210745.1 alcohol oxidase [Annulohypoxylon truncatum]
MGQFSELPAELQSVDIIVAGGGTAGCIVASRLADADPSLSILVIEAGPNGAGNPAVDYPAFFLSNVGPGTTTAAFYKGNKSKHTGNRDIIVPTGSVLGGGSAVNMMMYSRAQRSDWDSWQTAGWSANEILPFLKKLETYHGPGLLDTHGSDGPIQVSTGTFCGRKSQDDFVSAMNKIGWPEIEDLGSLDACNGVQRAVRFISPDGKRQDTASRYLRPRLQDGLHPNLHVIIKSQVVRVLIEDGKATGVVYKPESAPERTVKARKTVVLSCGAFGTPTVLERSGVGDPDVLGRAGIPIVADIPGVGHEYEDHHLIVYPYKSSLAPEETMDGILTGALNAEELVKTNDRILGWNAQDVTCKLRPTDEDVASLGPVFQEVWNKEFRDNPNRPLMMMSLVNCFPGDPTGIPPGQYFGISSFTVYPFARGHVHITGPKLTDPLDFETGFFSDEKCIDLLKHRWAYKKQREVARRMDVFRGELVSHHPPFPEWSKAACVSTNTPLDNVQDIEYSAEDDAIIDNWARENVGSAWHSLGTCKLGPVDQYGVVDQNLSVHGVKNLKLADLSIVPKTVAANTNNTALVIGEKAADIIIKELGLGKS